jgi:paraquat-inducible protein A
MCHCHPFKHKAVMILNKNAADNASANHSPQRERLVACPECDLLQQEIALEPGGVAVCQRCHSHLYHHTPHGLNRALACTIASLILFMLANSFPIIFMELQKARNAITLMESILYLFEHDLYPVAMLVLLTTIIIPAIEIIAMLTILLPLRLGIVIPGLSWLFRLVHAIRPWGMMEVFMLGIIVSLIRVAGISNAAPGIALWSFAGLMVAMTMSTHYFNPRELWATVEKLQNE